MAHLFCIFVVPHCRLIKPINPLIVQEPVSQGVHWSANLGRVCGVSNCDRIFAMSIENRFPHWLSSSISSYHSRRGQGLGVIVRCHHMSARTGHWDNVTCHMYVHIICLQSVQTQRDISEVYCQWLCTSSHCPKSMSVFLCLWNDSPFPCRSRWLHLAPRASHSEPGPICHVLTDFHVQAISWIPSPTLSSDQFPPNDRGWCQAAHVTHCVMCHTQTLAALVSSLRNFPSWQWYNFPLFCPILKTWQGHIQVERNFLAQVWQLKMDSLLLSGWLYVVGYGSVSSGSPEPCRPRPWQSDQWKVACVLCGQWGGREEMCNCWFQVMSGSNPVNMPLIICSADQTSRLSLAQFR